MLDQAGQHLHVFKFCQEPVDRSGWGWGWRFGGNEGNGDRQIKKQILAYNIYLHTALLVGSQS